MDRHPTSIEVAAEATRNVSDEPERCEAERLLLTMLGASAVERQRILVGLRTPHEGNYAAFWPIPR